METHFNHENTRDRRGRLVLVLERHLSDASKARLKDILHNSPWVDDVTMISGLHRASVLQADQLSGGIFYNRQEYLPPEVAFKMLPWREVWVISDGMVWTLA